MMLKERESSDIYTSFPRHGINPFRVGPLPSTLVVQYPILVPLSTDLSHGLFSASACKTSAKDITHLHFPPSPGPTRVGSHELGWYPRLAVLLIRLSRPFCGEKPASLRRTHLKGTFV